MGCWSDSSEEEEEENFTTMTIGWVEFRGDGRHWKKKICMCANSRHAPTAASPFGSSTSSGIIISAITVFQITTQAGWHRHYRVMLL